MKFQKHSLKMLWNQWDIGFYLKKLKPIKRRAFYGLNNRRMYLYIEDIHYQLDVGLSMMCYTLR